MFLKKRELEKYVFVENENHINLPAIVSEEIKEVFDKKEIEMEELKSVFKKIINVLYNDLFLDSVFLN